MAEFANFFNRSTDVFAIAADSEKVLADYPARNAHDLGDLFLGFLVHIIEQKDFALFIC